MAALTATQFSKAPNERQLWSGSPRSGIVLRPADAFLIPFSILWAGFAFFWEATVLKTDAPGFFALWGIPFVLVGLYVVIGRFFVDAWRRGRTMYQLTSDRVVITTGQTIKSLSLRTLSDVTLTERSDGSGTITFGPSNFTSTMYAGMQWPGVVQVPAFELIPDARRVYSLIRDAQKASFPGAG
jgi:hypothetical protein